MRTTFGECGFHVTPISRTGLRVRLRAKAGRLRVSYGPAASRTSAACPIRLVQELSRLARLRSGAEWFVTRNTGGPEHFRIPHLLLKRT